MLATPESIDKFICFLTKHQKIPMKSRTKLPCTFCNIFSSTTWRPGPAGPSTLCNKCGVNYMDSGKRHRTIDLVLKKGFAVWVKKDVNSWAWNEDHHANDADHRIKLWIQRESIRNKLTITLNPSPNKKRRL